MQTTEYLYLCNTIVCITILIQLNEMQHYCSREIIQTMMTKLPVGNITYLHQCETDRRQIGKKSFLNSHSHGKKNKKKYFHFIATSMYFQSVSLVDQLSGQFHIFLVDQFFFWSTKNQFLILLVDQFFFWLTKNHFLMFLVDQFFFWSTKFIFGQPKK